MKRNMWALGLAMLVLGFLLTTQYRVTQIAHAPAATDLRADELAKELNATKEKLKAAVRDNTNLKSEIDKLTKAGGSNVVAVTKQDPNLELLAGTVEAKGPGVILTVSQSSDVANKYRILDKDLWQVVQELWAAGAEGVSINGQRIVTTTAIRNVGQRMMINQTMTNAPYEVAAVGNQQVLEAAIKMTGGVIAQLGQYNIRVSLVRSDNVVLPGYGSVPDFQFMKPTK